ncbi:MAG: hypothetical protein ACRDV0_03675, partial [Acidimicrobiales bacterium]
VSHAVAQVRVANPGSLAVSVTLRVSLGGFSVPALTLTVGAYSSAVESITPNSSIPAAGFASVGLTSSAPVVASLATGTGAGVALTPAAAPGNALLVGGVVAPTLATLTNTSSRVVSVTFDHAFNLSGCTSGAGSSLASGVARVAPGATVDVLSVYPGLTSLACSAVVVRASRPSVIVTQALASEPEGVALVSALDGG